MTFEIITNQTGEQTSEVFEAIARICGSEGYANLITWAILLGGLWTGYRAAFDGKITEGSRWIYIVFALYGLFMSPKVAVLVTDKGKPTFNRKIDNMPMGVALFGYYTSKIGNGMADLFEMHFSLPGDLKYNSTGMLFGSDMILQQTRKKFPTASFASNMDSFITHCVFSDLAIGKYTIDELKESGDIWKFLLEENYLSQIKMFDYHNGTEKVKLTCHDGAGLLDKKIEAETDNEFLKLYREFYGNAQGVSATDYMKQKVSSANHFLLDLSKGATATLRQNMMINALYDTAAGNTKASAYIKERMRSQTRNNYKAMGMDIAYWMVISRGLLETISYAIFPFLFLLFCMPVIGVKVFNAWVFLLIWIQSWPIMFAIINLMVTLKTKQSLTVADGKITMNNINAIIEQDFSYVAGYMMVAAPLIMLKLLQGGLGGAGAHLSNAITGVGQSSATQVSNEISTGNMSIGNSSLDNHSYNNDNANKHDTSAYKHNTGFALTNADQSRAFYGEEGHSTLDRSGAISNLGIGISDRISSVSKLSEMKEDSLARAKDFRTEQTNVESSAFNSLIQSASQFHRDKTSGLSYAANANTEVTQAMDNAKSIADRYSGYDETRAGAEGSINGGLPGVLGNIVNIGGRLFFDKTNGEKEEISSEDSNSLKDSLAILSRASKDQSFDMKNSSGESLTDQLSSSYDKIKSLSQSEADSLTEARRATKAIERETSKGYEANRDNAQYFYDYLKEKEGGESQVSELLNSHSKEDRAKVDGYIDDFNTKLAKEDMSETQVERINSYENQRKIMENQHAMFWERKLDEQKKMQEVAARIEQEELENNYYSSATTPNIDNSRLQDQVDGALGDTNQKMKEEEEKYANLTNEEIVARKEDEK